jgi:hypothetical protein
MTPIALVCMLTCWTVISGFTIWSIIKILQNQK